MSDSERDTGETPRPGGGEWPAEDDATASHPLYVPIEPLPERLESEPSITRHGEHVRDDGELRRAVVVGYDATEPAEKALSYAIGMAQRHDMRVLVGYCTSAAVVGVPATAEVGAVGDLVTDAQHEVEQIAIQRFEGTGVAWTFIAASGDPVRLMINISERSGADAVIVGRPAGFGHRWLGAFPLKLLRKLETPLIVVP